MIGAIAASVRALLLRDGVRLGIWAVSGTSWLRVFDSVDYTAPEKAWKGNQCAAVNQQ